MAYDIIGNIAVIKSPLPGNLEEYARKILRIHKNVVAVYAQVSKADYPYRVAEYKFIMGERITETEHKEYGLRFKLDITRCYFSPRLENERIRIAKQVRDGEEVLVMFAGVNPYPIYIAKFGNPRVVYAVELNPWAFKYAIENVKLNKVIDKVKTILGDVHDVVPILEFLDSNDAVIKGETWYLKDFINSNVRVGKLLIKGKDKYDELKNRCNRLYKVSFINNKAVIRNDEELELELYKRKFDRIVMPLPKGAETFLDTAIPAARNGAIIHLYQFMYEDEIPDKAYKILDKYSKELKFDYEIINIVKAGDIAPRQYRVCIDFRVYF